MHQNKSEKENKTFNYFGNVCYSFQNDQSEHFNKPLASVIERLIHLQL